MRNLTILSLLLVLSIVVIPTAINGTVSRIPMKGFWSTLVLTVGYQIP